jgi:hypothetical protein
VAATAQGLLALLPASASRLSLALFPALLGQAAELSLALALALRLPPTSPAGRVWMALLLLGTQAAYIGSSLTVPALVGAWALLEGGRRGWREVAGVLLATLAAGVAVVLVLYGAFLPTLLREVLPHAGGGGAPGGGLGEAGTRLLLFFGPAGLGLGLLGVALLRGAPDGPRSAHRALLLAGAVLLGMRYLAPALFRDVKEVELLTPPVAIAAAVALHRLGRLGGAGRVAAVAGIGGVVWWGALEAGRVYAGRFLAVGL